ncbi:hypothetical protein [Paenibacillus terrae]|uniref:S1 motif domain-containing protein n=1 Tax=Paenibacillus terrae TaxID=159743 RepID=A0A0D7WVE5_9BACL|nr:hypothetical protein [Paenibacillus terrae]KJD42949.1 hypothetical protein QD47_25360 [Paenibacillus terrae]
MAARLGKNTMDEFDDLNNEEMAWSKLRDAKSHKRVLFARAVGLEDVVLGNLTMQCLKLNFDGIFGFLPQNKIDNYEFKGLHSFLGKTFEFVVEELIIEEGKRTGKFVANRIEALRILANRFWNTAQTDQIYEAFIRGIDPYNLYLLVEGVAVRVNRTEVDYSLYDDLREIFSIGDSIEVKIITLEKPDDVNTEGFIEVSARILNKDPWDNIGNYKERSFYMGKLVRIRPDLGMFVELESGLTALCNFPAGTHGKKFEKGEELEVKIRTINEDERRISGLIVLPRNRIGASNKTFRNSVLRRGASRG